MNGSVAKKTQETLGKVIKKPPLTEKLLSKPPFRYLHDIVSEVIRTTGFMKGLYGEAEMKSDNVKDKDSKMAFLQKAIDVVMLVSGEPVAAKPARIVAGHEPEKTNELLQTIAKCCLNKLSSDEAVRHVLAGDKVDLKGKASTSRSQGKENRKEKIKESTEQKDPDQPKEQESSSRRRSEKERHRDGERTEKARERDRTKDRDRDKDKSRDRDKEKEKEKVRDRDRDKEKVHDGDRDRDKEKEKNRDRDRDRTKDRERDSHKDRERVRDKDRDREQDKRRDREREGELQKESEEKKKEKTEKKTRATDEVNKQRPHPEELNRNHKAEPLQLDSPARIPRPSSAKGQRRRPKSGAPDESDSDGAGDNATADKPVHFENGDAAHALTHHASHSSRRIARPSSARPAPPRVRRQESYTDAGPVERLGSAKPSSAVIVDSKKLSEDEEDEDGQFVVQEAGSLPPDMPELEMGPAVELQGDEEHGGLVKKILETKKDYESSPSALKSKEQDRMPVMEAARKKERELVVREIGRLRTSVQSVCRSALPLGKIMDYIQEDMDSMQNELQSWRRENREHAEALLQEQRITDSAVKPLMTELAELEQLIMEEQDKICAIKSNILQNEEKIRKMVSSINISQT
ncbi:TRAF3-interacting protein 1 isoform X2 [Neoarius graeffei]|uniref:TRAF3-interacting protein 1 isoform X2 n=1 Tax=Neoarius graeffei TaxID=443677 RepID=UPI00298D41D6|nr:TRAF3-interacting protein 1 isoform X2 [Neoarius graeffei]